MLWITGPKTPSLWVTRRIRSYFQVQGAIYSSCFWFYRQWLYVRSGSYIRWLHWQCCGGPTGVSIAVMFHWVVYWIKHLSIGSIWIHFCTVDVVVEAWCTVVKHERYIMMKRSGKPSGIKCTLQVKMEWVTSNLHCLRKTNPTMYSCRLQGFGTIPQFEVSRSDVECLFTGNNCSERQLKSNVC
jgi:hypothetical protein